MNDKPAQLSSDTIDRRLEDLDLVLTALLDKEPSKNRRLVQEYVTEDGRKVKVPFHFNLGSFKLKCEENAFVKYGGSGIVLQCTNRDQPLVKYACKAPRPSVYADKQAVKELGEEVERSKVEYVNHAPLSHKNVARCLTVVGTLINIQKNKIQIPTFLFEWVEGGKPLAEYLSEAGLDWAAVVEILVQAFDGLHHVHAHNLVHWDVKSDNFLVSDEGVPKLLDIGNARHIEGAEEDKYAYSTIWNLPLDLARSVSPQGETHLSARRARIQLEDRTWDSPWLDLWMFARELNRLFKANDVALSWDSDPSLFPGLGQFPDVQKYELQSVEFLRHSFPDTNPDAVFALAYVRLLLKRLLAPSRPLKPQCYRSAKAVVDDLKKLQTEFGAAQNVPELQSIPQNVLRLPCSGNVPLTDRVRRFLNASFVRRLSSHLQLGIVFHVYPGATHRRSEHLFGVLSAVTQYIRALFADRRDPFWRMSIEQQDVEALLLAALLHDVGHSAFGHIIEELQGLFRNRGHEDYAISVASVPSATGSSVNGSIHKDQVELSDLLVRFWGIRLDQLVPFLDRVRAIMKPPSSTTAVADQDARLHPEYSEELKMSILHSIINSAIDADKLDYLLRDALHCGVEYSRGIDIDRFFQSLTCVVHIPPAQLPETRGGKNGPNACVGISDKGILPAEGIFIARYQMFSSVYWQHTVRAYTAMLQLCIQDYVGTVQTGTIARVEELLHKFRTLPDNPALEWLREKLSDPVVVPDVTKRSILVSACDALMGDRSKLYHQYYELRYDGRVSSTGERHVEVGKSLAEKLMRIWDGMNRDADSPAGHVERVRSFRHNFGVSLSQKLGANSYFDDGEVLIDIPPPDHDQIDGVYVVVDGIPTAIQHISPLADAVRDTFRYWARKVRVFIAPSARIRLHEQGLNDLEVRKACEVVMTSIAEEQNPQRYLFPNLQT